MMHESHDAARVERLIEQIPAWSTPEGDWRCKYDQQGRLRRLNLSHLQISVLSSELWQLTHLQELSLSDNQLTQLPTELGQLSALRKLSVERNGLRQLPPELGQLCKLLSL